MCFLLQQETPFTNNLRRTFPFINKTNTKKKENKKENILQIRFSTRGLTFKRATAISFVLPKINMFLNRFYGWPNAWKTLSFFLCVLAQIATMEFPEFRKSTNQWLKWKKFVVLISVCLCETTTFLTNIKLLCYILNH